MMTLKNPYLSLYFLLLSLEQLGLVSAWRISNYVVDGGQEPVPTLGKFAFDDKSQKLLVLPQPWNAENERFSGGGTLEVTEIHIFVQNVQPEPVDEEPDSPRTRCHCGPRIFLLRSSKTKKSHTAFHPAKFLDPHVSLAGQEIICNAEELKLGAKELADDWDAVSAHIHYKGEDKPLLVSNQTVGNTHDNGVLIMAQDAWRIIYGEKVTPPNPTVPVVFRKFCGCDGCDVGSTEAGSPGSATPETDESAEARDGFDDHIVGVERKASNREHDSPVAVTRVGHTDTRLSL